MSPQRSEGSEGQEHGVCHRMSVSIAWVHVCARMRSLRVARRCPPLEGELGGGAGSWGRRDESCCGEGAPHVWEGGVSLSREMGPESWGFEKGTKCMLK